MDGVHGDGRLGRYFPRQRPLQRPQRRGDFLVISVASIAPQPKACAGFHGSEAKPPMVAMVVVMGTVEFFGPHQTVTARVDAPEFGG